MYVKDMDTGVVTLVSVTSAGAPDASWFGVNDGRISADGRHVCFTTYGALDPADANGNIDVYVHDLGTHVTQLASAAAGSALSAGYGCSVSQDGRMVAFATRAAASPGDTNGDLDVYVRDMQTGAVALASRGNDDVATGVAGSYPFSISADGRRLAWQSAIALLGAPEGEHVYVRDLSTGDLRWVMESSGPATVLAEGSGEGSPVLSKDGNVVAFYRYEIVGDSFQAGVVSRDLTTGLLTRQSTGLDGALHYANWPSISGDGLHVSFTSNEASLVPGDTNGTADVFVATRP
jgi:Tol biopolymer transport system component